jgi:hypothetical protein
MSLAKSAIVGLAMGDDMEAMEDEGEVGANGMVAAERDGGCLHQNLEKENSRIRSLQKLHHQKGSRARIGISRLRTGQNRLFFEDDIIKLHSVRERHVGLYRKGRIRV